MKIYSSPACYKCNLLKNFLKEKGILFEEVDISKDRSVVQLLIEKGLSSLPIVEYQDKFYQGVETSKIKEILKI